MLLIVFAAAAPAPAPPPAIARTQARIRIERPVSASRYEWERLPETGRREIVFRDERGREILLRLIEQQ